MKEKRKVILINPNLVLLKSDVFTTGVVYMPFGLAYLAANVRAEGYGCSVIDAFGEKPNQIWVEDDLVYRGLTSTEVIDYFPDEELPLAIIIYACNLTWHQSTLSLIKEIKSRYPSVPLGVIENTQAVTAYSLENIQGEFYEAGANFVIMGEPEERCLKVLENFSTGASYEKLLEHDGIGYFSEGKSYYTKVKEKIVDLDSLPFPAWDLFPLKNYWDLKYSHGPLSSKKYLPILTSRGCPYPCRFCVIPETNDLEWRHRSAKNIVDELEHWRNTLGVTEFHIEDVNPTVNDKQTRRICKEIIDRKVNIHWKVSSGTKVETIKNEETIQLMAQAGCKYISISPESGSQRVMKLLKKPFDLEHAVKMIAAMNRFGIKSQACFVLGFPGEEDPDRELTRKMVYDLVRAGVSEIALFVVTPVPGSDIYENFEGYDNYSQLNFSPTWRQDYEHLNKFRVKLYREFLFWKVCSRPLEIFKQVLNFVFRRFETKMEMVPFRAFHMMIKIKVFEFQRKFSNSTFQTKS